MHPRFVMNLLLAVLALPPLAGCGAAAAIQVPIAAGIGVGSIVVFHRTPVDMLVSVATGRDCSVVNLDKGERYCRLRDPVSETPVFCTRSLGVADCWEAGAKPLNRREIADGPRELTPVQEADRSSWWPGLW
jgi:hypothetical protein